MSYEGYDEYLCERGHYSQTDAYDEKLETCPVCGARLAYWSSVDETNGVEDGNELTQATEKLQFGSEVFLAERPLYSPAPGSRWVNLAAFNGATDDGST